MLPAFLTTIFAVFVVGTPGATFVMLNAASQFAFTLSADAAEPEKQVVGFPFAVLFIVSVPEAIELLLFDVSAEKFAKAPLKPKYAAAPTSVKAASALLVL